MGWQREVEWIRCRYFAFWDVPRSLLLPHEGRLFLLDCPFEEEKDDYRPAYFVWELAALPPPTADALSWTELEARKTVQWADLPVVALIFNPNREHQDSRCYARVHFAGAERLVPIAAHFSV